MRNAARASADKEGSGPIRAPRGAGLALGLVIGLIVLGGLYLIAVRGDAIFLDLAAISGIMFCF